LKRYPAIDVAGGSPDLILATVFDFGPTAAVERGSLLRVFFPTPNARDAARAALAARWNVTSIEVPDDDWARRSQENLTPVTVGGITILPRSDCPPDTDRRSASHPTLRITIVIQPSMGFGTGHHATTRLCLAALQAIDVNHKAMLDVGTGSGVLAIASARLGATPVLGIDCDEDAIQSARENLTLNPDVHQTSFEVADLTAQALPRSDIITANLTGPLLVRAAPSLRAAAASSGTVIVSGFLSHERDDVCRAFKPASITWEGEEDGWIGMVLTFNNRANTLHK